MKKKRLYDIFTWIFVVLLVIITILFGFEFSKLDLTYIPILQIIGITLAYIYSIIIIISDFQIEDSTVNRIFTIIGSIIFPGILPLIVYLSHIRKKLQ